MGLNDLIDRLNNELDRLNKLNKPIDTNSFFTDDKTFNDDFSIDSMNDSNSNNDDISNNQDEINNEEFKGEFELNLDNYKDIEPDNETKDLVSIKEQRMLTAQNIFKKSIRVSLKAFLISLSLSFLNLFI